MLVPEESWSDSLRLEPFEGEGILTEGANNYVVVVDCVRVRACARVVIGSSVLGTEYLAAKFAFKG